MTCEALAPESVSGQYCPLTAELVAGGPIATGVEPLAAVSGKTPIDPEQGKNSRCVDGVVGVELAVGANAELHNGVVVLIDDKEATVIDGDGLSHGIAPLGRKRRGGNLAHAAGLGVDFKDVDLAVVVGAGCLGAGHVHEVNGQGLRQLGTGSDERGRQQAGRADQQELARFIELHAHLSLTQPARRPQKKSRTKNRIR